MISDINLVVSVFADSPSQAWTIVHLGISHSANHHHPAQCSPGRHSQHAELAIFSLPNLHRAAVPNDDRKIPPPTPAYGPSGIRRIGGASLVQAPAWNVGSCDPDIAREEADG
jgi:hypothetical protein